MLIGKPIAKIFVRAFRAQVMYCGHGVLPLMEKYAHAAYGMHVCSNLDSQINCEVYMKLEAKLEHQCIVEMHWCYGNY